jgi:hypothetical protein
MQGSRGSAYPSGDRRQSSAAYDNHVPSTRLLPVPLGICVAPSQFSHLQLIAGLQGNHPHVSPTHSLGNDLLSLAAQNNHVNVSPSNSLNLPYLDPLGASVCTAVAKSTNDACVAEQMNQLPNGGRRLPSVPPTLHRTSYDEEGEEIGPLILSNNHHRIGSGERVRDSGVRPGVDMVSRRRIFANRKCVALFRFVLLLLRRFVSMCIGVTSLMQPFIISPGR